MLFTLLYFILALFLLIIVHELGHFFVARWCGVKVLRFSFGFGKVLACWHDKRGTEYAWSLFPFGGYVKMLDEADGDVPEHERHLAFNNQSIGARVAIVLAGPLFNILFAFVALWLVLVIGIKSLAPMIDAITPNSIAARAGLTAKQEILSFNGKTIASWRDFQYALMPLLGTHERVQMTVKSLIDGQQKSVTLSLASWQLDEKKPDVLTSLGITPFMPSIPAIVATVVPDSPAQLAGLQAEDVILSIDKHPIADWLVLVDSVKLHPSQQMTMLVSRHGERVSLVVRTGHMMTNGREEGFLGLVSRPAKWPENWLRVQREGPLSAMGTAFTQTYELTASSFVLIGRLITGQLSWHSISGPVGIAKGAGESARNGLVHYLSFLALVSISLGVLNLLPIPLLDGGHLFYYLVEAIIRRPLSAELKSMGVYVGLILMVTLTMLAMNNDLTRL